MHLFLTTGAFWKNCRAHGNKCIPAAHTGGSRQVIYNRKKSMCPPRKAQDPSKAENRVEKAKMEELTVKNCEYKWVMAVTSIGNYAETKKMPGRRKSSGRGADISP